MIANNKPERRRKNLIRPEVNPEQAISWSKTRMGGRATDRSPILVTTITLKRLMKRGYQSNLDLCFTLKFPHSLMNRCLRGQHEQWCERLSLPAMPAGRPPRLPTDLMFLIIVEPAFGYMDFIVLYAINQTVFTVNSS